MIRSISYTVVVYDDGIVRKTLPRLARLKRYDERGNPIDEIIIFDGGSRPEIIEIERRYADRLIRGRPGTFGGDRNRAAAHAMGDIIVSMEGEAFLPLNTPQRLEEAFEDEAVVGVVCDIRVYPWEETGKDRTFRRLHNLLYRLRCQIGWPAGKGDFHAFRASVFRAIGGYANLHAGEDEEIWQRLRRYGKVVYLKDFCVYESPARYRQEGYVKTLLYWMSIGLKLRCGIPIGPYKRVPKNY